MTGIVGRDEEQPFEGSYALYGMCFTSEWRLPYGQTPGGRPRDVRLVQDSLQFFSDAALEARWRPGSTTWFHQGGLRDGSIYLRWSRHFEFVISADGGRIAGRSLNATAVEAFHAYLLGQVLSYSMIKRGTDPLHGTAVVVDGAAVAFLGDCGYGKSSLGAAFLEAGHRLLTDDLLAVEEHAAGFAAHPGPPRIKLFPLTAAALLGEQGRGTPLNDLTPKLVIPLGAHQVYHDAAPLHAIYLLTPPSEHARPGRVTIRRMSQRKAFVALLRNTFNAQIIDRKRLERQFTQASRLAARVPIKALSYPRQTAACSTVRDAILTDLWP